jgi:hypothetical protein
MGGVDGYRIQKGVMGRERDRYSQARDGRSKNKTQSSVARKKSTAAAGQNPTHPFTFRSLDPARVDEGVTAPSRGFLLNSPENRPFFFFCPLSGVTGGFELLRVEDGAADTRVPPPSMSTDRSNVLCVTSTSSELYCVEKKQI